MNIEFKSRKELYEATKANHGKYDHILNEKYLRVILGRIEQLVNIGSTYGCNFDPDDYSEGFYSIASDCELYEGRSWYSIIRDLETILLRETDWNVEIRHAKYADGSNYYLSINWGEE